MQPLSVKSFCQTGLFLNRNLLTGILLCKVLLVSLYLSLLDLNGLDRRTLEGLLDALLCELGCLLDIDGLELGITCESIRSDLLELGRSDLE